MTNIQRNATEVISISLPKPIIKKLEKERITRGQSRSAFIASLINQISEEERWKRIYKKGAKTRAAFQITSEEDIDKILHEA